jgi:universal stress protein E
MKLDKLVVVFDPTREDQPALQRAGVIAAKFNASLHLFACIHSDTAGGARAPEEVKQRLDAQQAQLDQHLAPLAASGITTSSEVEWDKDWYHAAVRAAARSRADMVLKSSFKHSAGRRILKSTSDWTLIRECLCPVMLVKTTDVPDRPRILAGIDISVRTAPYEQLNEHILDFSRGLLESALAEVHVVNAFPDYRVKPSREDLMAAAGVDKEHAHVKLGPPDRVIVEMARRLDASLVVVGNSHRSGLAALMHGNTAEKILDRLDCNVLAMP